ncbi:MAG TPA: D-2-hydroxyacid dehydrogenase [Bacteroidales bacterium]|nr:D-2-hydroxyacid dehydrogenase [Bacteroidales bacterium]
MKIVVLDGYTLNPGDLSWDEIAGLGELRVYDRTPPELVAERTEGAAIVLTNKVILDGPLLRSLPELRYIGVMATGYNVIDTAEADRLGIIVTNIPAYGTNSVAQLTFALILSLCNNVMRHSDEVMKGRWSESKDFTFRDYPLTELSGKTLGIIGFGSIGKKVCEIAMAFGMNVIATSRSRTGGPPLPGFEWAGLQELLSRSDIVTIHCPLTPENAGMINIDNLRLMKRSSFLINTARGPLIAEKDLADALNQGIIAGAGLDVLSVEPPPPDNPLLRAKNCIITPHIAWATLESRKRLMHIAAGNISAFLDGKAINVVNKPLS